MHYKDKIKNALSNKYVAQYLQLLSSTLLVIVLQFLVTMLFTNNMQTTEFADYKQVTNTLLLFQSLFLFGFPFTISFLIARYSDNKEKIQKFIGIGLEIIIVSVLAIYLCLIIFVILQSVLSFHIIPDYWILFFPLSIIPLMQYYLEYVCMGMNKIQLLSIQKLSTQISMIVLLLISIAIFSRISLNLAILIYGISNFVIILLSFLSLRPIFRGNSEEKSEVLSVNPGVGFPTYIGGLFSVASVRLVTVIVAYFVTRDEYAFYSLAITISTPLGPFVSSLGSILYKKFSTEERINTRFLQLISLTIFAVAILYIVGTTIFVPILFGDAYIGSIIFAQIIGIGSLLSGFGDVFNRFLGSKGEGKSIKQSAITSGVANLLSSIVLLPFFGALGASISRFFSNAIYLIMIALSYRGYTKKEMLSGE